jgi:hypothetical protein
MASCKNNGEKPLIPFAGNMGHPLMFRFGIFRFFHFVYGQQRNRAKPVENTALFPLPATP